MIKNVTVETTGKLLISGSQWEIDMRKNLDAVFDALQYLTNLKHVTVSALKSGRKDHAEIRDEGGLPDDCIDSLWASIKRSCTIQSDLSTYDVRARI